VKLKIVKNLYVVPFLCPFTNIITLISSSQESRVVGYEYVNEKATENGRVHTAMENNCGI
jgi:hypothetical protein